MFAPLLSKLHIVLHSPPSYTHVFHYRCLFYHEHDAFVVSFNINSNTKLDKFDYHIIQFSTLRVSDSFLPTNRKLLFTAALIL